MKRLWFLLFALCSTSALAGSHYYYLIDESPWSVADGIHYPTPDAACAVIYPQLQAYLASSGFTIPSPYTPPTLIYSQPPDKEVYNCQATGTWLFSNGVTAPLTVETKIKQAGDKCVDAQVYNPLTTRCEDPADDQERKELGDSDNIQTSGGVLVCKKVGDPINAATGNVFEAETDYQSADGGLRFTRYFNSATHQWTHNYSSHLMFGDGAMQVSFDDGHASLFKLTNGVATAEPTELGRMDLVNSQWVYTSPANERFTFDKSGRLASWQQADGLVQTLTYVRDRDYSTVVTVTDARGQTLSWRYWPPDNVTQLVAGDLTVDYTWKSMPLPAAPWVAYQLTKVISTRAGNTATRGYAYNDARSVLWLTGITDERGTPYTSWTYDDQGRATSSQHAGGADLTTVTYNGDGSSTVTNALGHPVTYHYQVIQGTRRITGITGEPAAGCPASNSSFTYNDRGQVATQTDALNHVTAYSYDTRGREISRIEAQGTPQARTITTTWDATWPYLRKSVTTPDQTTTNIYDSQGRLQSTTVHDNKGAKP